MAYVDPYALSPARERVELLRMTAASLVAHAGVVGVLVGFAGSRLLEAPPVEPERVWEVALVTGLPAAVQHKLPDKVTSAPPPPAAEDVIPLPDPSADPPPPPDIDSAQIPEEDPPKPPEQDPDSLKGTLERLASLKSRLQGQPSDETPVPGAPLGLKNRPETSEDGATGTRSAVKSYNADSPEGRYLGDIKAQVVQNWIVNARLAREQPQLLVIIRVKIAGDGRLVMDAAAEAAIVQASGDVSFDQSALRAVRMVAQQGRFPDPPASLVDETVDLRFSPTDAQR